MNGRHRRSYSQRGFIDWSTNTSDHSKHKNFRRLKRQYDEEDLEIKLSLSQTKHRMRIIKIQPSVKVCSSLENISL